MMAVSPITTPGTMVDEKVFADGRPGMNVNAGNIMGIFAHDPGNQRHRQLVQLMGQPVNADGKNTRGNKR